MSSAVMDMYLNASDSMTFQDMLDIDMKSEIDALVNSHSDFSSNGYNFSSPATVAAADLLPSLEFEDMHDLKWFSTNSNSSLNLDFACDDATSNSSNILTKLVNPNAVMPSLTNNTNNGTVSSSNSRHHHLRSPSPLLTRDSGSHLTFSPSTVKLTPVTCATTTLNGTKCKKAELIKTDLLQRLDRCGHTIKQEKLSDAEDDEMDSVTTTAVARAFVKQEPPVFKTYPTGSTATARFVTTATAVPLAPKTSIFKTVKTTTPATVLTFRNAIQRSNTSNIKICTSTGGVGTLHNNNSNTHNLNSNGISKAACFSTNNGHVKVDASVGVSDRLFPKPAYSYSCLIAMALKNSRSGSLPVSEIYNFMCRHFPYFLTAPNGWKNSVRHNLSLNKCFEKIEKPALNGAQRKGCLWAMNPAKISKMDEEVQKWSRKDPVAIRKAMINPDELEPLERGELKFSCSYDADFADSCGSADSEEGSDCEHELSGTIGSTSKNSNGFVKNVMNHQHQLELHHPQNGSTTKAYRFVTIRNGNAATATVMTPLGGAMPTTTFTTTTTLAAKALQTTCSTPPLTSVAASSATTPVSCQPAAISTSATTTTTASNLATAESDLDVDDLDIEVTEGMSGISYVDLDEDEQDLLKMEMELAQKDLLEYEDRENNKRRRTYIIHH